MKRVLPFSLMFFLLSMGLTSATKTGAIDYLKGIQQNDGSWLGDRESNEIATAKALIELCKYEAPTGAEIVNGTTWLKSRQSSKGWYGKTQSNETATAWAVEALQTCKDVDYIIHDFRITFVGSAYQQGDPIFLKLLLVDEGNYSGFVTGATGNISVWDSSLSSIVANQSMTEFGHGLYYYSNDTYHFSVGSYMVHVNMTYSNTSAYQILSFDVHPRELNATGVYSELDSGLSSNFTLLSDKMKGLDTSMDANFTEERGRLDLIRNDTNTTSSKITDVWDYMTSAGPYNSNGLVEAIWTYATRTITGVVDVTAGAASDIAIWIVKYLEALGYV